MSLIFDKARKFYQDFKNSAIHIESESLDEYKKLYFNSLYNYELTFLDKKSYDLRHTW